MRGARRLETGCVAIAADAVIAGGNASKHAIVTLVRNDDITVIAISI
jgi:hypothetical protein